MDISDLGGVVTALITPFRDGRLDEPAFMRLVERQVAAGVQGVIVGSQAAGEGPTLEPDEARRLIELCVSVVAGRVVVIADGSSNATSVAIDRVRLAHGLGADAALVSAPWYNRPSQEGVFLHFEAIAEAVDLPLLIGNAPQRAALDVQEPTLARLAALPQVIGLEEMTIDVARFSAIRSRCGDDFKVLAGRDASALGALAQGAQGVSSLTANVDPGAMVAMHRHWAAGDAKGALVEHDRLFELHRVLAEDPSPVAMKLVLSALGLCEPDVRGPITPVSEEVGRRVLATVMRPAHDAIRCDGDGGRSHRLTSQGRISEGRGVDRF